MTKPVPFEEYEAEMKRLMVKNTYTQLNLPIVELFAIIGGLQLALRHPEFPLATRNLITNWIIEIAEQQESKILRDHIYQGFDRRFDL